MFTKNPAKKVSSGALHQLPFYAELAGGALGEGWTFGGAELLFLEVEEDQERSATLTADDWKSASGGTVPGASFRLSAAKPMAHPARAACAPSFRGQIHELRKSAPSVILLASGVI